MGWRPSLHDNRDLLADLAYAGPLPKSVDLRGEMPGVYDQGDLGSCTANAVAACVEFYFARRDEDFMPSRLWIYYGERQLEGTLGQGDTGAFGRDGFKVCHAQGVPPEADMPYDVAAFEEPPSSQAVADAPARKIPNYKAVPGTPNSVRAALAYGQPVAFGFTVYESFETIGPDGMMPLPQPDERVLGGHEVVIVGYDRHHNAICRNSWGPDWADGGHFYMPMLFVESANCSDFRTIHPKGT